MERATTAALEEWLASPRRRPLVLRGARQVGKTWLIRDLAARSSRRLLEINFERSPALRALFAPPGLRAAEALISDLEIALGTPIALERSLLFLDEVQAAPEALAALRWLHEELPALPVAAAGSLLEFVLSAHSFSMPVGRVSFRRIGPLGFPEFLRAHGQFALLDTLSRWRPGSAPPSAVALETARGWHHRFSMVGGMPALVAADVSGAEARELRAMQQDLVAAYRADFAKYAGRMDRDILDLVLRSVAMSLGRKFVFARADDGINGQQARRALERLVQAGLCLVAPHTDANGLPLAAEARPGRAKVGYVDVGLLHALIGTPAARGFPELAALAPALRGQLAEQIAAQHLAGLALDGAAGETAPLFYWQRDGGRAGEIDYLLQVEGRIVPIELKSGSAGSMKSLHQFMYDKRLGLAVRCDANPPSLQSIATRTTRGDAVEYRLLNVPPWLLWNLPSLLADLR